MEKKIVNIAEYRTAQNIVNILSEDGPQDSKEIYEFSSVIYGKQVEMIMISVELRDHGQLSDYDLSKRHVPWRKCDPITMFDDDIIKTYVEQIINREILEEILSHCKLLIIWTCDNKNGDYLSSDIMDYYNIQSISKKFTFEVCRARISKVTRWSTWNALNNLEEVDNKIRDGEHVKRELEIRTAAAFSRLQTIVLENVFPPEKLPDKVVYRSFIFPTLRLVVERCEEYKVFREGQYQRIKLTHISNDIITEFNWDPERLGDQDILLDNCQRAPIEATVESVRTRSKTLERPLPLTTIGMVKKITEKLKITATKTMQIAQFLHRNGFISYPHTTGDKFLRTLNLERLVKEQINDPEWGAFARDILNNGPDRTDRIWTDIDEEHRPIFPTKYTNTLSGDDRDVYKFIVKHFLASIQCHVTEIKEFTVRVNISGNEFQAEGRAILANNCMDIVEKRNDVRVSNYKEGDTFILTSEMVERTSPSQLLTEADLMDLMDQNRIGTVKTYVAHINSLILYNYVRRRRNPVDLTLKSTAFGTGLIRGYQRMNFEKCLTDPNTRDEFERDIQLIFDGIEDPERIRSKYIEEYRNTYKEIESKISSLCETVAQYLNVDFKPVLKCPKCGKDMICKEMDGCKRILCIMNPICEIVVSFNKPMKAIDVLDETCTTCEENVKKIRIHVEENILPAECSNPYTLCIKCCDEEIFEVLDIDATEIRKIT